MADVYLGLGSNLEPEKNLRLAVAELGKRFEISRVSRVYRSKAIGFDGDEFLNAVVAVRTNLSPGAINRELEAIHATAGRERGSEAFVSRTLDIDLLMYDQVVSKALRLPRSDVLDYAFVLRPLAEIAPDLSHPVTGKTMAEHWGTFAAEDQPLAGEDLILSNGDT